MKKRIMSAFLAVIMLFGMLTTSAFAANSEEEALGEIDIYNGGYKMSYLSINGRIREQIYTYYRHVTPSGAIKEVPAYCVNPNDPGVPQTVGVGESIKYLADEKAADPKVTGIIANGYPNRGLSELGLENKEQAYYATKMALWCYLLSNWDISNLKVNPNLTGMELQRAQKILAAAKDIYRRGTAWTENLSPNVICTPDRDVAYEVTVNGRQYKQQIFTITSKTWVCDYKINVAFTDPASVPEGTRIVDMSNNDITTITTSATGEGYSAQFKVLYPIDSIAGETGSVQLSFDLDVYQYAIFYASVVEVDKYGNLQNYMVDTDPTRPMELSVYSNYGDEPEVEMDTGLQIVKYEAGTTIPLSGAMFEVVGPDGATVGTFTTDSSGKIRIPLLLTGNYTVYERVAPDYYMLSEESAQNITVVYGEVAEVVFENEPYGNLRIEKTSDTGMNLPGAMVMITHIESGKTYTGETNSAGVAVFNEIMPGAYRIQETAAPAGWLLNDTIYTTNVVAGEMATFHLVNEELPGLRIIKYDRKNMVAMSGVTFEVWRDGISLGTFRTDEFGEVLLTDVEPGTYRAVEIDVGSDGYILDTTPQEVELEAGDGIKELMFFNDVKPGLRLVKVDSADPSKVIPNVLFEIKSVAGDYGPEEFRTDENGEIDLSELPAGAYVVTEKSCPGYVIDEAQRIIQLNPNEDAQFVFTNSIKPSLHLIKLSSDGSTLQGVTFRISKIEDGTHYLDRTTNQNGEIMVSDLEPGVYSVRETATVSDHIIDLREYKVELFAGKTSTLVIENQQRPNLYVYKHDADTGEPVPDTVFIVHAADGHSVDEIRTDTDGRAELKNLLPGVYEITEKSVPSDYLLDAPSQLITLYPNRDHTVYFKNHQKPGLTVNKVDSVTGSPIEGAKFEVWYGSNNTQTGELNSLGTYFSDANGRFVLSGLRDGWYKVTELEPAPGYTIKEPATQEFYIKGGEHKEITFQNVPLNAIIVEKYDSVTGEALAGATFQLRYFGGASGTGGTVIGQKVTGGNGTAIWTGLEPGTYVLEEVDPGDGYSIIQSSETIYLADSGEQSVVTVRFENMPDGILLIRKVCATNPSVTLQDAEFKVMYADGTLIGDSNGIYRTDENGEIRIEGLKPGKSVVVTETRAPAGFNIDTQSQTVQIKEGRTVSLTFKNEPNGKLIIQKRDSTTGQPLSGAEFRITTAAGCEVGLDGVIGTATLTQNGIFTTDANGEIRISNLTPGAYVLTEIKASAGYVMDQPSTNVVIGTNGDTQTVVVKNSKAGTLVILKEDSLTGKPLKGVTFKVTTSTGEFIQDANGYISSNGLYQTDKDGKITINGVVGTLVVTETKTIPGYTIDPGSQTQTVNVQPNATQTLRFFNTPSTTLVIEKYIEGTDNEPLAGVTFLVTDSSGAAVGRSNGEYITDTSGRIEINGLTPGTTVTARETKTVDGFVLDGSPKSILIKEGEVQTLRFYNARQGALVIRKLDSVTKEPLAGVEFELTYADGGYVDDDNGHLSSKGLYTTNANGEIRINGITGTIVVKETKTIEGYTIDESTRTQTVVVNPADTQTLTFYNHPIGGVELIKVDKNDPATRIPNVTFEIRRMDDGLVTTVTTGKNGRVFTSLEDGAYYAVEVAAAKGYRLDPTPQYFEVVNGKMTTLTVTNEAFTGLIIHKVDANTGRGIYGVTFLVYDGSMNPVTQVTTDQNGYAYVSDLGFTGKLYLREMEAEGYVMDTQLKTVYVKAGETTEITWKNTAITAQIQIWKKSADDNTINGFPAGTPLEGAIFEIYDKANRLVETVKSDKRGLAISSPLPLGRYIVKEVQAPAYYAVSGEAVTVYLEHAGQIVQIEVLNESVYTNVSISKSGYTQVVPGQSIRYTFKDIGNNSTTPLDSFYWRDTLPTDAVRLDKIITGTWSAKLNYKVVFQTNLNNTQRVLADNLNTQKNYTLDASAAALGLASNEYVTQVTFLFGRVPAGFKQVDTPYIYCDVLPGLTHEYRFTNKCDVGGIWKNQWIQATDRWVTIVYRGGPTPTLPRTGY